MKEKDVIFQDDIWKRKNYSVQNIRAAKNEEYMEPLLVANQENKVNWHLFF